MAIGDNYNDIEMLEFAGHAYIMGNATEELRDRGWNETLGNNENALPMPSTLRSKGWNKPMRSLRVAATLLLLTGFLFAGEIAELRNDSPSPPQSRNACRVGSALS